MTTNADPPISCFSVPELDSLPADIQQRLQEVQDKAGFIPNVMRVLARRPAEFWAFMTYHDVLMESPGNLSKAEREMIVVATSGANHCLYCVVAHGAILRIRSKNPLLADQVATNYRQASLTKRQQALLDYAMKVSQQSYAVGQADREAAKQAGLSDEDLWDIANIAAFFAMSNRLASAAQIMPNTEFYSMGR
jgi:4-carboxymuconolactone decarboxylase